MTHNRAFAFALPLASLLFTTAAPALAAPGDDDPPADGRPVVDETPTVAAVGTTSNQSTDFRNIFRFHAGPLTISPTAILQVQGIPYVGSDSFLQAGDPGERGGFRLRRARFGVEGRAYRAIPFKVSTEFSSMIGHSASLRWLVRLR